MKIFKNQNGKLRLFWAIIFVFVLSLIAQFIFQLIIYILVAVFYMIKHKLVTVPPNLISIIETNPIVFLSLGLSETSVIFVVYLFTRKSNKMNFRKTLINFSKNNFNKFVVGILIAIVGILLVTGLGIVTGVLKFNMIGTEHFTLRQVTYSLIFGAISCLFIGLSEEILFRGYILTKLRGTYKSRKALIISAVIFMIAHFAAYTKLLDFSDVFLGGILLGYLYSATGSLHMSIGFHFMWNYLQLCVVKLQDSPQANLPNLLIFNNPQNVYVFHFNLGSKIQLVFSIVDIILIVSAIAIKRKYFCKNQIKLL